MTRLAFHTILLIGAASSAFGAPTPSPPPLAGALQAGSQIPANSGIQPELNIMAPSSQQNYMFAHSKSLSTQTGGGIHKIKKRNPPSSAEARKREADQYKAGARSAQARAADALNRYHQNEATITGLERQINDCKQWIKKISEDLKLPQESRTMRNMTDDEMIKAYNDYNVELERFLREREEHVEAAATALAEHREFEERALDLERQARNLDSENSASGQPPA
ncbi:hypothetical protein F5878DRAFT_639521 [Lentinula raphanica]|uniref:Uncharacterized protein n=1 Tax=Lentinula raphanica TaxID=153919 RepID=A0AA38PF94_9AGAR|nr:hypothetical protein F5878DRAFT_639521 [Lentinula raphanica]